MGIYSKRIEEFFSNYQNNENILHNFDNWTYHIQLYMVPKDVYKSYTNIKSNFTLSESEKYNQIEKIILNNKIIIAESGVTSGISIDTLNLAAFTPTTLENRETTTTSIDMTLSEVNSCTLMNKIAMASYVCGYQSYTSQPFFLEIWFTGYSNKSGKPVSKIYMPISGTNRVIYSCVLTTKSSIVDNGKTTYNLKLYPYYYGALTKELNVVNDIGEITADASKSYAEFISEVEQKINEKLAGVYGKEVMDTIYKGSTNGTYNKPVEIIIDDGNPVSTTISDEYRQEMSTTALETADYAAKQVEYNPDLDWSGGFWSDTWQVAKISGASLWNGVAGSLAAGAGFTFNLGRKAYRGYAGMKRDFTPEEDETLSSFIRRISTSFYAPMCRQLAIVCNFNYSTVCLEEHKGRMYYKHYVRITSNSAPGLKEMNNLICNYENSSKHYTDNPVDNQEKYLDFITEYNLLIKKYKWLLNGENTDVLNVKRSDDNLWYMNIGISNIYNIRKNRQENKFNFDKDTKEGPKSYNITVESAVSKFNKIRDEKANNGDLYIDDIYRILTDDDKQEGLRQLFGIVEASDPTAALKPDSIPEITKESPPEQIRQAENEVNYKVGMYNIFQYGGQKLKVDMDIIGDPFWLIMGSEKDILTYGCRGSAFMPHIILNVKTFMNLDNNDNYEEDKFMDLTTVYIITQVTSFFDNGKFTQKLNGFVATPFIQSSAIEKSGVTLESNDNKRASKSVPNG